MRVEVRRRYYTPVSVCGMTYLRYIREKRELSQDKLSELSGIPQNSISLVERGKRAPASAKRVLGNQIPALAGLGNLEGIKRAGDVSLGPL